MNRLWANALNVTLAFRARAGMNRMLKDRLTIWLDWAFPDARG